MKLKLRKAIELATSVKGKYPESNMDVAVLMLVERGVFYGSTINTLTQKIVLSEAKLYLDDSTYLDIDPEDIEAEIFRLKMEKV